jgi:uncharacterized protein YukE
MTTIHIDLDACRSAQHTIADTCGKLNDLITAMNNAVGSIENGTWVSDSATEFFIGYDQWRSVTANMLTELSALAGNLQGDINYWETVAKDLE